MGLYDDLRDFVEKEGDDLDDDYYAPLEFTVTAEAGTPSIEATYSLNNPRLDMLTHMAPPPGSGETDAKPVDIERTLEPPTGLAARLREALDRLHGGLAVPAPVTVEHPRLECEDGEVVAVASLVHEVSNSGLFQTLARSLAVERDDFRVDDITEVIVRLDFDEGGPRFKIRFFTPTPVEYSTEDTLEEFCEFRATFLDEERGAAELLAAEQYEVVDREASERAERAVAGALDARLYCLLDLPDAATVDPRRFEVDGGSESLRARVELPVEV